MLNFQQYFNQKTLKKYGKICTKINNEFEITSRSFKDKKDEDFAIKMEVIRTSSLDEQSKLIQGMALAKVAAQRALGMSYYDVQLMGALALANGSIAEMKTGEGKTLMCTAAAVANYLLGFKTHIATANEYLAQRDFASNKPLFDLLGIKSSFNISGLSKETKRAAYDCDVLYSTAQEFGFDYLRDNLVYSLSEKIQPQNYHLVRAIIDEADFILIDEARTPLIISGDSESLTQEFYMMVKAIADNLQKMEKDGEYDKLNPNQEMAPGDFWVDYKTKNIHFSEQGYKTIEKMIKDLSITSPQAISILNIKIDSKKNEQTINAPILYHSSNLWILHEITNALKAKHLFLKDKQYIVRNNQIVIVDENTGRLGEGRTWSDGLHQAIEAKEGVRINSETRTLGTISVQNYFRLYQKISGMTGTAMDSAEEFEEIYNCNVVQIPTNKKMIRKDLVDSVFLTAKAKYTSLVEDIVEQHQNQRPILIGTVSVEESEVISSLLNEKGIKHNVLNAKNHAFEAQIIAQAGMPGAVTVSTSMAGRGTDIILGGNKEKIEEIVGNLSDRLKVMKSSLSGLSHISTENMPADLMEENEKIKANVLQFISYFELPEGFDVSANNKIQSFVMLVTHSNVLLFLNEDEIKQLDNFIDSLVSYLNTAYEKFIKHWEEQREKVKSVGGLYVIGSSRNESRRIDDQLKGRSGRQGDPGASKFYLSFEDQWLRTFAQQSLFQYLKNNAEENVNLSSPMISRAVSKAQRGIESLHYGFRKNTFQYDSILDESRRNFFGIRNDFLKDKSIAKVLLASTIQEKSELFDNFEFLEHSYIEPGTYNLIEIADFKEIEESTGQLKEKHSIQHHLDIISNKDITFNEKYVSIMIVLKSIYNLEIDLANKITHYIYLDTLKGMARTIKDENGNELLPFDFFNNPTHSIGISNINEDEIKAYFKSYMMGYIESLTDYEKITTNMIVALDDFWLNYLNTTEEIRKGINLVTYINKNPIFEYKKACFDLFSSLVENFRNNALNYSI